eukprot:3079907-Prymnesium_polylepis.1
MDAILDAPLREYGPQRLVATLLLPLCWFVGFPMYVAIFSSRPFSDDELAGLSCSCAADALDAESGSNVSAMGSINTTADICGACGGAVACEPHPALVASSFGLHCSDKAVLALPSSCVTLGILVGAFFGGPLSDRIGRRPTLLGGLALQAGWTALTAAAPSFPFYLAAKLVTGVGMSAVTQAGYTLSAEIVGPRLRTPLTIEAWSYCWATMVGCTAMLAYALRGASWRTLELTVALPAAALLAAIAALVPESPRWLLKQGRRGEAEAVLRRLTGSAGESDAA